MNAADKSTSCGSSSDADPPRIECHPYCVVFPQLAEDDLNQLADDIKCNGLQEPITMLDGMILDGRNRYLACLKAGIEPKLQEFDGTDPLKYVLSRNMYRRHLNESQRAMVADRIATMRSGARTDLEPRANLPEVSKAEAASRLSVSPRTVGHARKVRKKGSPELVRAVENGSVSVSRAAGVTELPHEQQIEALGSGKKTRKTTSTAVNGSHPEVLDKLSMAIRDLCAEGEFKDLVQLGLRCIDAVARKENPHRESDLERLRRRLNEKLTDIQGSDAQ